MHDTSKMDFSKEDLYAGMKSTGAQQTNVDNSGAVERTELHQPGRLELVASSAMD